MYQHLFKCRVLPLSRYLSLLYPICCPCPVLCLSLSSVSLLASLLHSDSPTFSVFPPPPPFSLSLISRFYGAIPRNLGIPGSWRQHRPRVPCCPSARWLQQEGWAKGRGRRPQQPNLQLQPGSDWERNEETRNLGTEGVGVRSGKGYPRAVIQNHSRLYEQIWG